MTRCFKKVVPVLCLVKKKEHEAHSRYERRVCLKEPVEKNVQRNSKALSELGIKHHHDSGDNDSRKAGKSVQG